MEVFERILWITGSVAGYAWSVPGQSFDHDWTAS